VAALLTGTGEAAVFWGKSNEGRWPPVLLTGKTLSPVGHGGENVLVGAGVTRRKRNIEGGLRRLYADVERGRMAGA
jgi:hypothetical protein